MSEKRRLLGRDLRLTADEEGADLVLSTTGDLATVFYEENLGQAMLNKLRTRIGELTELGHSRLGSRLYQFIGEPNNPETRDQIKSIVKEALSQDSRIREITRVEVKPSKEERDRVDIEISVVPIGSQVALNLVMPCYLEVA